jgi:hypothetical protein
MLRSPFILIAIVAMCSWHASAQTIVINEILSVNDRAMRDPIGDFDDYVELFNAGKSAVSLAGYFISDDKDTLNKCRIPAGVSVPSGGYLLIWLDAEMDQEGIHCPFKLNAKGERILLSDPSLNKLDEINLKRQFADVSFGRLPSGGTEWQYIPPTPAAANSRGAVLGIDRSKKGQKIKVSAAASKDKILVEIPKEGKLAYRVIDKEQKVHLKGVVAIKGEISLTSLANGRYKLLIGKNEYRILKQN